MASARCDRKECEGQIDIGDFRAIHMWIIRHHLDSEPGDGTGHKCHSFTIYRDDYLQGNERTVECASGRITEGYHQARDLFIRGLSSSPGHRGRTHEGD